MGQPADASDDLSLLDIERFKALEARRIELTKTNVAAEEAAFRAISFLNGGAIVSLLGFAVHGSENGTPLHFSLPLLKMTLAAWALGLVASGLANCLAHISRTVIVSAQTVDIDRQLAWFPKRTSSEDALVETELKRGGNLIDYASWSALAGLVLFILGAVIGIVAAG